MQTKTKTKTRHLVQSIIQLYCRNSCQNYPYV